MNSTLKNGPKKICFQNGEQEFYPQEWAPENISPQEWGAGILLHEWAQENMFSQNREQEFYPKK